MIGESGRLIATSSVRGRSADMGDHNVCGVHESANDFVSPRTFDMSGAELRVRRFRIRRVCRRGDHQPRVEFAADCTNFAADCTNFPPGFQSPAAIES